MNLAITLQLADKSEGCVNYLHMLSITLRYNTLS